MPIRFSVMIEAPLTGKGAVSFTAKRMHNADVELTLGANAFVAQGALGGPNDKLAVRVDAPRLAVLDKSLQGRARQLRAAPRTSCGSNSP